MSRISLSILLCFLFLNGYADDHDHKKDHPGKVEAPKTGPVTPAHPHNNISRTPSLSHAKTWSVPSNPTLFPRQQMVHHLPPTNPSQNLEQFLKNRPATGGQLQNVQGTRLFYKNQSLDSFKGNLGQRDLLGQRVRGQLKQGNLNRGNAFNNQFWQRHHFHPSFGYGNWWNGSSWRHIKSWVPWGYAVPLYYENEFPVEIPEPESDYAEAEVPAPPVNSSWLPLGVFGLLYDLESETPPSMFFQLALNREGGIAGTYYNQESDKLYPVYGIIEKATQRAVWKIGENEPSTVFQTGIYNLSLPQTSVTVIFANGEAESWFLVRMSQ